MGGIPHYPLWISGEFVPAASGQTLTLLDPASQEPLAEVASAGPEDVERAVGAAHRAFTAGPWRRLNTRERGRLLLRVADLIRQHADELARTESCLLYTSPSPRDS